MGMDADKGTDSGQNRENEIGTNEINSDTINFTKKLRGKEE